MGVQVVHIQYGLPVQTLFIILATTIELYFLRLMQLNSCILLLKIHLSDPLIQYKQEMFMFQCSSNIRYKEPSVRKGILYLLPECGQLWGALLAEIHFDC